MVGEKERIARARGRARVRAMEREGEKGWKIKEIEREH